MRSKMILKIDGLSNSQFLKLTEFLSGNKNKILAPEDLCFHVVADGDFYDSKKYYFIKLVKAQQKSLSVGTLETDIVLEIVTSLVTDKDQDFFVPRSMIDELWNTLGLLPNV